MSRNVKTMGWGIAVLLGLSVLLNFYFLFQQSLIQVELKNLDAQIAQIQKQRDPVTLPMVEKEIQNLVLDLAVYGQKQPAIFGILEKYGIHPPLKNPPPSDKSTKPLKGTSGNSP